jgi:archaemetzincin
VIELLRTEGVEAKLLDGLAPQLERTFGLRCRARPEPVRLPLKPDPVRNQYYSSAILQHLNAAYGGRILAVTEVDLFVPVLTFVFGEAQLPGTAAVVSIFRLSESFYGMPTDESALRNRLLKEAVHELGHTFGLLHCDDWQCVMTSSHAVERLDIKSPEFCTSCGRWLDRQKATHSRQQPRPWILR